MSAQASLVHLLANTHLNNHLQCKYCTENVVGHGQEMPLLHANNINILLILNILKIKECCYLCLKRYDVSQAKIPHHMMMIIIVVHSLLLLF